MIEMLRGSPVAPSILMSSGLTTNLISIMATKSIVSRIADSIRTMIVDSIIKMQMVGE